MNIEYMNIVLTSIYGLQQKLAKFSCGWSLATSQNCKKKILDFPRLFFKMA